ncbi:MAG: dTMP kinase [Bdellovibrionota bacterium]
MSRFITIEGIEGAGKSTLRSRLSDFAASLSLEVVITREPGATVLGQSVRSIVLDPKNKKIHPVAELMLFCADRAQHLEEVVRPALERGAIVFCDRYVHSTIAYQGYGRGLDRARLEQLNALVTQGLMPDLVLLLDLPPEVGLDRARQRTRKASGSFQAQEIQDALAGSHSWSRFEEQELAFHQRVRSGFLELAKDPVNNIVVLNAAQNPEQVAEAAIDAIKKLLGK